MTIKESQIDYETPCGVAWVLSGNGVYYTMVHKGTHATTDSAYRSLCLAKARADYIAKRSKENAGI